MSLPSSVPLAYRLLVFVILLGVWVAFSGLMDAFHLTLGVISCALVTALSADMLFENRQVSMGNRVGQAGRLVGYLFWLLGQIVVANIHILKLVFGPQKKLHPQVVCYETKLESDFEKFLLANSITLTPGTVTIKIIGNTYYIHAIDDVSAAGLDEDMERRIAHIFRPAFLEREFAK